MAVLPLEPHHRQHNVGGNCRWASLDAAAKFNGNNMKGWFREQWDKTSGQLARATDDEVEKVIKGRTDSYIFDHKADHDLLTKYANTHGCVVSFVPNTPGFGFHSVYLIHYGPYCYFYDPNDRTVKERPLSFFKQYWWGDCVVLLEDK